MVEDPLTFRNGTREQRRSQMTTFYTNLNDRMNAMDDATRGAIFVTLDECETLSGLIFRDAKLRSKGGCYDYAFASFLGGALGLTTGSDTPSSLTDLGIDLDLSSDQIKDDSVWLGSMATETYTSIIFAPLMEGCFSPAASPGSDPLTAFFSVNKSSMQYQIPAAGLDVCVEEMENKYIRD